MAGPTVVGSGMWKIIWVKIWIFGLPSYVSDDFELGCLEKKNYCEFVVNVWEPELFFAETLLLPLSHMGAWKVS